MITLYMGFRSGAPGILFKLSIQVLVISLIREVKLNIFNYFPLNENTIIWHSLLLLLQSCYTLI